MGKQLASLSERLDGGVQIAARFVNSPELEIGLSALRVVVERPFECASSLLRLAGREQALP